MDISVSNKLRIGLRIGRPGTHVRMQASDVPATKMRCRLCVPPESSSKVPPPPGSRPRNLIIYIYILPTKNIMGFFSHKGKEETMNVEEFQEEKLCARCGHSEGRHKTAGGFCKHCPCDGFVEEKEHTDGKDCWCHPEVIFMADNGNKVWVHKGAGEELAPAEVIAQAIADAIANKGD